MPSPFPGMDPYLERRSFWPDFHARFINYVSEQLQPQIRPKYNARIEERIHLIQPPHDYYPDLTLIRYPQLKERPAGSGGLMVADEPHIYKQLESEFREPYIEIIYLPTGDVVTTIELLSPINKSGEGRARYQQKQQQILKTDTSLVRIDLWSGGDYTVAAPEEQLKEVAGWRYLVSVKRAREVGTFEIYYAAMHTRLPRCGIPLRRPDPDAVLDLPAVFDRTYDVSGCEDLIDYREPPSVTLSDDEASWLDAHLAEQGATNTWLMVAFGWRAAGVQSELGHC